MILNGSQRGGGLKLAAHLMNLDDNDHVEVHEVRGFVSDTLRGALQEAEAVASGTRCRQFLYSLSLNPPASEHVPVALFEEAVEEVESRLGLSDQPRAIVFHEKNGRRHAHAVWSRIDVHQMKAINLPFTHLKLREISRGLYLDQGWRLPDGLRDRENRDPRNFDLAEWQQAKRAGRHARAVKQEFQEAWATSDTGSAFAAALEEKGYFLARGDRGRVVAVDVQGEVYAVPRWTGQKAKAVRAKLGDTVALKSVAETKAHIAAAMQSTVSRWRQDLARRRRDLRAQHDAELKALVEQQRADRERLKSKLEERATREARQRQAKFRAGLVALWDRVRGAHARIRRENERQAWAAHQRDQTARDDLVFQHLEERQSLARDQRKARVQVAEDRHALLQDRQRFAALMPSRGPQARDGPQR